MQICWWQGSLLFGQGCWFLNQHHGVGRGGLCPTSHSWRSRSRGSDTGKNHCGPMGQGVGQTRRWRSRSLAQLRGGEGWAAAGHCPVHGGQLPDIPVSCSAAGHEPSHSEHWCPLVLSGVTTPLWVIQGTVGDRLQRKGGWSLCVEAVMKQCQSHRWGSNLFDTFPALVLMPQGNTELLARCLSPPSMPPLPAHRTPVTSTREQWELLRLPFPSGFISVWIFLPLISSLWFLLFNRIK